MFEETAKRNHYRRCVRMYADMMIDLSRSDKYLDHLIQGVELNEFENALRGLVNGPSD